MAGDPTGHLRTGCACLYLELSCVALRTVSGEVDVTETVAVCFHLGRRASEGYLQTVSGLLLRPASA